MGSKTRHRIAPFSIGTFECFAFQNSAFCDAVCYHELTDFLGVSPTDDDVVVADRMLEQVRLQVHIERDLSAAEMVTIRHFDGLRLGDEIMVQLRTAPFK